MKKTISLTVNGESHKLEIDAKDRCCKCCGKSWA